MLTGLDQLVPLHVTALPEESTATQKVAEAHETEVRVLEESMLTGLDQVEPFHVITLPDESPATQKVVEAHETEVRLGLVSMVVGADHPSVLALAEVTPSTTVACEAIIATTKSRAKNLRSDMTGSLM